MGKASRRKRQQRAALEGTLTRAELQHTALQKLQRVQNLKGPKTSAVLLKVIEPYLEAATNLEEHRRLVEYGMLAWNWAVDPDLTSRERIKDTFRQAGLPSEDLDGAYHVIDELRRRKLQLFPDDHRLIVSTEVHEQDERGCYITATAVAPADPAS